MKKMRSWQARGWFFSAYFQTLRSDSSPTLTGELLQGLMPDDPDMIDTAMFLFLATSITRQPPEPDFLKYQATDVAKALARSLAGEGPWRMTWQIALFNAALRRANLGLRNSAIRRLISGSKNHVYGQNLLRSTLMSGPGRRACDFDVLLACVPFCLFEPEDLVLVEAVKSLSEPARLEAAAPPERFLLAWYFVEQGNYGRARAILQKHQNADPVRSIVVHRLGKLGQLSHRFIRHKPDGNGNRYEPQADERFPKLITEGDIVTVGAICGPCDVNDPVELITEGRRFAGSLSGDVWTFQLPAQPADTDVSYKFQFTKPPHAQTALFSYRVLRRQALGGLQGVFETDKGLSVVAAAGRIDLAGTAQGTLDLCVKPGAGAPPGARPDAAAATFELAGLEIDICIDPLALVFRAQEGEVFRLNGRDISWLAHGDSDIREISIKAVVPQCRVFGLGERYNALDQYGQRVDQFVYNQYKDQGLRTYMPMPVFYTDHGFGFHIDTTSYSWFDFGVGSDGEFGLGIEQGELRLQILSGSVARQVSQFIALTGEPELVPDWALGPWMSSNNWDSEAEVRAQVALGKAHDIPATVLVIEAWSDENTFYIFNDAIYEETDGRVALKYADFTFPDWGRWPDPKGLVAYLHQNDLKCVLWQIPVIKHISGLTHLQNRADQHHAIENEYCVKNSDSTPYRLPEGWFKDSLILDFTNEKARSWWFAKRQYLIDELAIDGFKTDGGECVFGNDLKFADASTGLEMRNRYPRDYVSAYFDFVAKNEGITFSRSGYSGSQRHPCHWAGDERSNWGALERSLLAGLSAGMSGVIFWGWDLAGFSGPIPSAELYVRSAQFACFCPIMQYHAESKAEHNQDRTPWNIAERTGDPRVLEIYRFYANLRMSLLQYIRREARHCIRTNTPLMRAMVLDHQDDYVAAGASDQYSFGRDLIVAPVIVEGASQRTLHLPGGRWWHLFEDRWYGPGAPIVPAPLESIPVFVREGAAVPLVFDEVCRLGARMSSSVTALKNLVILVAGNMPDAVDIEIGNAHVWISCSALHEYDVEFSHENAASLSLVFCDDPVCVRANGQIKKLSRSVLSGRSLATVTLA